MPPAPPPFSAAYALPHYLRCHANCSWPAITLDLSHRRLLALWPFAAATAYCKLLLVACHHCPISYRRHATILMSWKSLPHLYILRPVITILPVCLGGCPGPPFTNHTLTPSTYYVEVNLFNFICPLPSPLISYPA